MSAGTQPYRIAIEPGILYATVFRHLVEVGRSSTPCWTYVSEGFGNAGQPEIVMSLLSDKSEQAPSSLPFGLFKAIRQEFASGLSLMAGQICAFDTNVLPKPWKAVAFIEPEKLEGVDRPATALAVILLTADEANVGFEVGLNRVTARLGLATRRFPCPPWSDRRRSPVVNSQFFDKSILANLPRAPIMGATMLMQRNTVTLSIPSEARESIAKTIRNTPIDRSIAITSSRPDPDANAILVWQPGQRQPDAITPPGSKGERVSGNFIVFVPRQETDDIRIFEDGFAALLTHASWSAVRDSLTAGGELEIADPKGDFKFELDWLHDDPWSNVAVTSLENVKLLTPEIELTSRVGMQTLARFIQRVVTMIDSVMMASPTGTGHDLTVNLVVGPDDRIDVRVASNPRLDDATLQQFLDRIGRVSAPPVFNGTISLGLEVLVRGGARATVQDPAELPPPESDTTLVYRSGVGREAALHREGSPYGEYESPVGPGQDPKAFLKWIDATDNPFRMRVLDCRPLVVMFVSITSRAEVANRFAALRNSHGEQHRGQVPAKAMHFECDLRYPLIHMSDGPLFRAPRMEDKWDIFLYDRTLYFARSWIGILEICAQVEQSKEWLRITAIDGLMRVSATAGASYAVREVDFLVKSHLYRREVPHPLPAGMSDDDPEAIAGASMMRYGRWASFATFDDPTTFNPWPEIGS